MTSLQVNEDTTIIVEFNYESLKVQVGSSDPDKLPLLEIGSTIYISDEVDKSSINLNYSKLVEEEQIEKEKEKENEEEEEETKLTLLNLYLEGKVQVNLDTSNPLFQQGYSELNLVDEDDKFNFEVLQVLLYYSLITNLNLDTSNKLLLFVHPSLFTPIQLQYLVQIGFEVFNVGQISCLDRSLAVCYGYGLTSGIAIEIGDRIVSSVCLDCKTITSSIFMKSQFSLSEFDKLMLEKLKEDSSLVDKVGDKLDSKLVKFLRLNNYISFEDLPTQVSDENSSNLAVQVQYDDIQFELGVSRFMGQLFVETFSKEPSLQNLVSLTCYFLEKERKLQLFDQLLIDSPLTVVPGFYSKLEKLLSLLVVSTEAGGYFQPTQLNFQPFPEYFINLKKFPYYLPSLGSTIASKYIFSESKLTVNKLEYNEVGPAALHSKN